MPTVAAVLASIAYVAFVGIDPPVLRHDWILPPTSLGPALEKISGWDPQGLGDITAYPSSFLIVLVRALVGSAFGAAAEHVLFLVVTSALISFGAAFFVRGLGGMEAAEAGGAFVALFNPWTYNETVAGHQYMLLAYGSTYWLIGEVIREHRKSIISPLIPILIAAQIQFLVINSIAFVYLAIRKHSIHLFLVNLGMLLPIAVGVTLGRSSLTSIPFTLAWERGQSLNLPLAIILQGYFAHYDAVIFEKIFTPTVLLLMLAALGIVVGSRRRQFRLVLLLSGLSVIPLTAALGVNGPFGSLYSWLVINFPAIALFRELYDLLGWSTIGYLGLAALPSASLRGAGTVLLCCGLAMPVAWVCSPPSRFWIPSSELPRVDVKAIGNARVLYLPAITPFSFLGSGSGDEPNPYSLPNNTSIVNQRVFLYPISSAVGELLLNGSTRGLAALSVKSIVNRPWLLSEDSASPQFALPILARELFGVTKPYTITRAIPELSLSKMAMVGSLVNNFGAGNVRFDDARAVLPALPRWSKFVSDVELVKPSTRFVRASDGWVDARLAFLVRPELGQSYGGALTTNIVAMLPIVGNRYALVFVDGKILSGVGRVLSLSTKGYRWIKIPAKVTELRCFGLCVVAAETKSFPSVPLNPAPQNYVSVSFHELLPWLIVAELPNGPAGLLRYNVAYSDGWMALEHFIKYPHVRIDGAVNGWTVPARSEREVVVLLEWHAGVILLSELIGALLCALVLAASFRSRMSLAVH